jgi:hypothetical protein
MVVSRASIQGGVTHVALLKFQRGRFAYRSVHPLVDVADLKSQLDRRTGSICPLDFNKRTTIAVTTADDISLTDVHDVHKNTYDIDYNPSQIDNDRC